jgi:hypothetical protein
MAFLNGTRCDAAVVAERRRVDADLAGRRQSLFRWRFAERLTRGRSAERLDRTERDTGERWSRLIRDADDALGGP